MGKKRRNFNEREQDQLQKLKLENQRLKRSISTLRKQISRIDIESYENLKDLLDKQDEQDFKRTLEEANVQKKKKWECFECKDGTLILTVLDRLDGQFYYRRCNNLNCRYRTKLKKWNKDVEN